MFLNFLGKFFLGNPRDRLAASTYIDTTLQLLHSEPRKLSLARFDELNFGSRTYLKLFRLSKNIVNHKLLRTLRNLITLTNYINPSIPKDNIFWVMDLKNITL